MNNKIINTPWQCPRCGEIHLITKNGIDHMSKIGGFHFIRWSLSDFVVMKEWKKSEYKKIKLYE